MYKVANHYAFYEATKVVPINHHCNVKLAQGRAINWTNYHVDHVLTNKPCKIHGRVLCIYNQDGGCVSLPITNGLPKKKGKCLLIYTARFQILLVKLGVSPILD